MSEDRPQYAAKTVGHPTTTHAEIAERLQALACEMHELGTAMDYVGGFGPMSKRGRSLINAAWNYFEWAQEIEGAQG